MLRWPLEYQTITKMTVTSDKIYFFNTEKLNSEFLLDIQTKKADGAYATGTELTVEYNAEFDVMIVKQFITSKGIGYVVNNFIYSCKNNELDIESDVNYYNDLKNSIKVIEKKSIFYNWTDEEKKATAFIVNGGISYYDYGNGLFTFKGALKNMARIDVEYVESLNAMKIINGDTLGKIAIGYYLKDNIYHNNGVAQPALTIGEGMLNFTEAKPQYTETLYTPPTPPAKYDYSNLAKPIVNKQYTSSEDYTNALQNGLRVKDLRGVFGMPHQFLPNADARIDNETNVGDSGSFGRVYTEKIVKHIPLLLMTPGKPVFLSDYTRSEQHGMIAKLLEWTEEGFAGILNGDIHGKYYSLEFSYTEYFYYVNAMLRSAALFLEIDHEEIDGSELGYKNWLYHNANSDDGIYSHENLGSYLGPHAGCVAFYADAGTTADDSFTNSTTDSQLASMVNTISDKGRELNFILGNVGGQIGIKADLLSEDTTSPITDKIDKILGSDNVFSNILSKGQTLIGGGRMIFPEIWSDSSFSRSYSCSMKLVSPSGDKLSIFLNILVPIYHLLAFTLPRETSHQSYFSPFLVRAYYKGLFNVDMGLITSLSITKGDEGEWTVDGIPTVANINFEIKDLYDGMAMSKQEIWGKDQSILSNITELDYIANSCGINVNDQEISRTLKMGSTLGFGSIHDKITIGIFGEIGQWFNQKLHNIFGKF